MVKKGRRIQPVPGVDINKLGGFNANWEELQKLASNVNSYYKTNGELFKKKSTGYKNVEKLREAYRNVLRSARDIQKEDVDIVNKKYGDNKVITESDFFKRWIAKRPYYAFSDDEINKFDFFEGTNKNNFNEKLAAINEFAAGVANAARDKQRNPEAYWKWFEDKAQWGSNQSEAVAKEEVKEEKEVRNEEWDRNKARIDGFIDNLADDFGAAYLNKLEKDNKEDKDWLDKLADDYTEIYDRKEKKIEDVDENRRKELEYLYKRWDDPIGTREIKPNNTPDVEEPENKETRDEAHTTPEQPAQQSQQQSISIGTKDGRIKQKDQEHLDKANVETKDANIVPTKRFNYNNDKDKAPLKIDEQGGINRFKVEVGGEDGGKKSEKTVDIRTGGYQKPRFGTTGRNNPNIVYDARIFNNQGRTRDTSYYGRAKPNPSEVKNPEGWNISEESKRTYTDPVYVPQYSQPTNIHDMLNFDYALTTNAEYMRSRIQEANNKMFPRKDLRDVKKMRKLRIDNNKNIALKGGMPISAYF